MDETQNKKAVKFLFAASGSGGHLFPAVFIAEALRKKIPEAQIEFIGSGRPLERQIIDVRGFVRTEVSVSGIRKSGLAGILRYLKQLPSAVSATAKVIKRFKPDVIIGVGGYVSVLPVLLGYWYRTPTWIHEAELKPGLANWLLSFFADKVSLAFPEAKIPCQSKAQYTGHPLRPELKSVDPREIREDSPRRLLVLGGSQGASALDRALPVVLNSLKDKIFEVVHQSRQENIDRVAREYAAINLKAHVVPFIENMAGAYSWSDVIVSRSGAGAVVEISAVNRPAVFVPYPHQQGNHQTQNAMTLVEQGKALLVEETGDFSSKLREALSQLFEKERFLQIKARGFETRGLFAAETIAEGCLGLAQAKHFKEQGRADKALV